MRLVLATGVFDLLHVSHVRYLQAAARMGTRLVVGVTADAGVGKPGRPVLPEAERAEMVLAVQGVDTVLVVPSALAALETVIPHVWARGHEYRVLGNLVAEDEFCRAHGVTVRYTSENAQSTTGIIARIKGHRLVASPDGSTVQYDTRKSLEEQFGGEQLQLAKAMGLGR